MADSCRGKGNARIFVVIVTLLSPIFGGAAAETFKVGGTPGWNLGVNYTIWGAKNIYHINDILNFVYLAEQHDVLEVSEADFQTCTTSNAIKKYFTGNDTITIEKPQQFFICAFVGHCSLGMKLAITTARGAPPPTAAIPPPVPAAGVPPPSVAHVPPPGGPAPEAHVPPAMAPPPHSTASATPASPPKGSSANSNTGKAAATVVWGAILFCGIYLLQLL